MTELPPTFKADEKCYVKVDGFTIYIEVSEDTQNMPYVYYYDEAKAETVMLRKPLVIREHVKQ